LLEFLHVDENDHPAATEHPTQAALPDLELDAQPPAQLPVALTGAALAGAIDKVATARPVTNSDAAFMATSQIAGTALAIEEGGSFRQSSGAMRREIAKSYVKKSYVKATLFERCAV
jgi:hypothetical protein